MLYIIKYGKRILWMILSILLCLIIINALYYFNFISTNIYKTLEILIFLINIFISTFILGKSSSKKGYLEGIKYSLIIISIFIVLTLLINEPIKLKILIYYLIIIITSILGSTMGINRKKEN